MFNKKEILWIIISIIIFGFIIGFSLKPTYSYNVFLISFIIISINILTKKFASKYFNVIIEHKIWEFQRWGWYKRSKFKKPKPIGLILPFFLSFLSLGAIKIMTFLQFNGKPSKKRILKKRGRVRQSKINESDLAFISAWGFYALLLIAIIGAIFKIPQLTKYSVYYGIWNLLPLSELDGSKLFFGSFFNWCLLAIIYIVSLVIIIL